LACCCFSRSKRKEIIKICSALCLTFHRLKGWTNGFSKIKALVASLTSWGKVMLLERSLRSIKYEKKMIASVHGGMP
jgi:hypothetical protein